VGEKEKREERKRRKKSALSGASLSIYLIVSEQSFV
jgi:hypothetical protein